jgi:hypothetical protein
MKRIVAMAFVAAVLCVPAAQAAAPKGPTMAQFNALKAQLVKDEKKIKDLQQFSGAIVAVLVCENAINADAFQGTWQAIDTLAVSLAKPAVFGPQTTTVNDANLCGINTITRSHAVPPTVSVFSALATLLAS